MNLDDDGDAVGAGAEIATHQMHVPYRLLSIAVQYGEHDQRAVQFWKHTVCIIVLAQNGGAMVTGVQRYDADRRRRRRERADVGRHASTPAQVANAAHVRRHGELRKLIALSQREDGIAIVHHRPVEAATSEHEQVEHDEHHEHEKQRQFDDLADGDPDQSHGEGWRCDRTSDDTKVTVRDASARVLQGMDSTVVVI